MTLRPREREPHRCKSFSTVLLGTALPIVYRVSLCFTGGISAGQAVADYLSEASGSHRPTNTVPTLNQALFEGDPLTTLSCLNSREQVEFERQPEGISVLEAPGIPEIPIDNDASSGTVETKDWAWYKPPSDCL